MVFSKKSLCLLSLVLISSVLNACGSSKTLTGAGASFPAPLYTSWFSKVSEKSSLRIEYQSVGSGAGVNQFLEGTVDFAGSDVAMSDEELAKAKNGALMLPLTAGSVVIAYNVPGVTELKLSRESYAGIFLGEITKWNDPRIVKDNPELKLPELPITVVHRSDGSGTTAVFSRHLSAIDKKWASKIGEGKSVRWPDNGTFIGAKGNEGVTALLAQQTGTIGYVEYAFAKSGKLNMAALENKAKSFVAPSSKSASAALESVVLPENLRAFAPDPEGKDSYPIVTYSWLLTQKKYSDPSEAKGLEVAIEYALNEGQNVSEDLGYVPLPISVRQRVAAEADKLSHEYVISLPSK